jgi:ectoine hydroxylase-related dioxygenase (phytanoyl-CoA dioxygenase family)
MESIMLLRVLLPLFATSIRWHKEADCNVSDLQQLLEAPATDLSQFPTATEISKGVLIYDAQVLLAQRSEPAKRAVQAELVGALMDGPGVVAIRGAFPNMGLLDEVNAGFYQIISDEKASGVAVGDHFGKPGENSRIWNALEKLAIGNPSAFVRYHANEILALVSEAWLGRDYQVTSQVNIVHPGGSAQSPHLDYHLGFQGAARATQFPSHVHALSRGLTLQGAVAHSEMPIESGPTQILPHSQKFETGYVCWPHDDFKQFFKSHQVQLPLKKGDAMFFNPSLFHAAGENYSPDIQRIANLMQISLAFGRAMETVDRHRLSSAIYPALSRMHRSVPGWAAMAPVLAEEAPAPVRLNGAPPLGNDISNMSAAELSFGQWSYDLSRNVIASSAEGYAFPTNLDLDQPLDGKTLPSSQADLVALALDQHWTASHLDRELFAQSGRRGGNLRCKERHENERLTDGGESSCNGSA